MKKGRGDVLDFPDGPVVKTVLLMQGVRVWPLVWELRSHMPWCVAKKKKIFFLKEMSCQLDLKKKNILHCFNVYKYHDGVAFMQPVLRRAPSLVYCFAVAILKFLRIYLKTLLIFILHWVSQIMVPVLCSKYLTWTFSINPHGDMAISIPLQNLRV